LAQTHDEAPNTNFSNLT